ncbi:MAG: hypothetical protein ABR976_17865 [Terracidiphilus sp.]
MIEAQISQDGLGATPKDHGRTMLRAQLNFTNKEGTSDMRIFKPLTVAACALLTILLLSHSAPAQDQFPAYLHAISDLRTARAYLEMDGRPKFEGHRRHAIEEMDKALGEMKKAAIDDGKSPWEAPPPQNGGDPAEPIHSALKLLDEAHNDVGGGADSPENRGLQMRSLKHIDEARAALHHILEDSM